MGRDSQAWEARSARGDHTTWITPAFKAWKAWRAEAAAGAGPAGEPAEFEGIPAAFAPAFQLLDDLAQAVREGSPQLKCADKLSIQLACYPGGGTRYAAHIDAFPPATPGECIRQATCILYLNDGWQEGQGGALNLIGLDVCGDPSVEHEPASCVTPAGGRVVVFDSHTVRHEVQPAHAPRWALTCWLYGTGAYRGEPAAGAASPTTTLPSPPPALVPATPPAPAATTAIPPGAIFVSIPAYRDPQARATLWDLFATAENPSAVFVGVVQQLAPDDDDHLDVRCDLPPRPGASLAHEALARAVPFLNTSHVRVLTLPAACAAGPVWARHLAHSLWQGEDFVLCLDSHMRMVPGWDRVAKAQLAVAEAAAAALHPACKGCVLSSYPAGFEVTGTTASTPPAYEYSVPKLDVTTPLRMDLRCIGSDGWPRFRGSHVRVPLQHRKAMAELLGRQALQDMLGTAAPPFPTRWWAAGLSFQRAEVLQRVPFDPALRHVFFGEETLGAARLATHGVHIFAPGQPLAWHLWTRAGRATFREHASLVAEREQARSTRRMWSVLAGDGKASATQDAYGLGDAMPVSDWLASAGLCLNPGSGDGRPSLRLAAASSEVKRERTSGPMDPPANGAAAAQEGEEAAALVESSSRTEAAADCAPATGRGAQAEGTSLPPLSAAACQAWGGVPDLMIRMGGVFTSQNPGLDRPHSGKPQRGRSAGTQPTSTDS